MTHIIDRSRETATHIIVFRAEASSHGGVGDRDIATLYRASDGMSIAEVNNKQIMWGLDTRQPFGCRLFIDHASALGWLKLLADVDASGLFKCANDGFGRQQEWEGSPLPNKAVIETRDEGIAVGESRSIVLPDRRTVGAFGTPGMKQ